MSNPLKQFMDSWDELERKLESLVTAGTRDEAKRDEVLKGVRQEMTRLRSDVEGVMGRIEKSMVDLQSKVSEQKANLEKTIGSKVLPMASNFESLKETVRSQSNAIQALQAKAQEIESKIDRIQGAFTIMTGGR